MSFAVVKCLNLGLELAMILARCRVRLLKLVNFVGFLNQTRFWAESTANRLVF